MHHGRFHRRLLLTMLWVVDHPRRVLLGSVITLVCCAVLALTHLGLSTNQDELFSSKVKFFSDYINFTKDFPENQAGYVMIEAGDSQNPPPTARWIAAADAITDQLRTDTADVKSVDSHIPLEQLGKQGILFEDPKLLQQEVNEFQQLTVPFRPKNFLNSRLGDVPLQRFLNALQPTGFGAQPLTDQTAQFSTILSKGLTAAVSDPTTPITLGNQVPDLQKLEATDPAHLGYYYVEDEENHANHLLLVRVFEHDNFSRRNGLADAINGIRDQITKASVPFTQLHKNAAGQMVPEFVINLTGRPALEADEMATTDHDARTSEIAALTAVFIGLVLLLRSLWVAIVAELALLVGIGWTFGWATVSVHRLNLLSLVFLIALTGIGMDYLIQVLTRYRREAARRVSPRGIWTGVFKYVSAPINTACLGAAGAFFVSIFTSFRGAAELGIVASGGLLLCLLTCYLILPPLLTLFPAKPRPADAERHIASADRTTKPTSNWRHLWLAPPVLWVTLLFAGIPFAERAKFDPGLLKMQAQSLQSVKLIHKLQTWSAAELSYDLSKLRTVRTAVQPLATVAGTESILTAYDNLDWLHKQTIAPIDRSDYEPIQPQHLPALIASARKLSAAFGSAKQPSPAFIEAANSLDAFAKSLSLNTPAVTCDRLSKWQQIFIGQLQNTLEMFRPTETTLDLKALPDSLKSHLIGIDGQFVLYIYPRQDLWHQANLEAFVFEVEKTVARLPDVPPVTGIAINVYHSTSSIRGSFYDATGYALALIFVLVLVDLKNIAQTVMAISVLAMGLPMLVALMGLLHIDWNFANFFGLPILIGAGHEYGVFMVHRYNEAASDPHRRWRRWDVSDKALLLCGYVTSVSFGFFWLLGHHEGLKSLGLVMALGTGCIYLATLCVLRPLLLWKLGRAQKTVEEPVRNNVPA